MAETLLRIPADVSDERLREIAQTFYDKKVKPALLSVQEVVFPDVEDVAAAPTDSEPELLPENITILPFEEEKVEQPEPEAVVQNPAPPVDARVFGTDKAPSLEFELQEAIAGLKPESVDPESARVIFDLAEGRRPVHCPRAGLTDSERRLVWDVQIDAWWSALGKDQREKFVGAAHRVTGRSELEDINKELAAARILSYRRMLDGIFSREPERMYETYDAVKNGKEPYCPHGFSADAQRAWKEFLVNDWFVSLSADEKIRMDAIVVENKNLPARISELKKSLTAKSAELTAMDSIRHKITNLFAADKQAAHNARREALVRQLAEVTQEYREIEVKNFLHQEVAELDARLHSVGDRAGFGARILDAVKSFFNWTATLEKIKTPSPLRGRIFGGLSGVYQNVPATIERWMLEAACAETAGALREKRTLSPNAHQESADDLKKIHSTNAREIDWSTYLLALQHRITVEIARATHRGQSLASAVQKDPLAGLLAAYKEAAVRVAPQYRKQGERLNVLLTELLAQTQAGLYVRGAARTGAIKHMVASNDTQWIQSLLDERTAPDTNAPTPISGHPERAAEKKGLGLHASVIVGPQMTAASIVREFIQKFDPQKSDVACNRDTLQFMSSGNVSEVGAGEGKHFLSRSGGDSVALYVGDKVTAIQDITAPLGFRIEITRNPPPPYQGHILDGAHGKPDWYYQRVVGGRVYAWKFDDAGAVKLAGHFEGRKFVHETERSWAYHDLKGNKRTVGEFAKDVFFTLDGAVVSKNKHGKGRAFTELGKLDQPFGKPLVVVAADGTESEITIKPNDQTHFVTPKNVVVTFHASVNEMRELGALKR